MTLSSCFALFTAMVVLAVVPGPGIFVVVSRTIQGGLKHGLVTTAGIVCGDFVFIAAAKLGLAALSGSADYVFTILKYFGAAYLTWLGLTQIIFKPKAYTNQKPQTSNYITSYSAGLMTTLSNPKAILFYLSFFPVFVDLSQIDVRDTVAIYLITTLAVGGVMAAYAVATQKTNAFITGGRSAIYLRFISAFVLISSGVFIYFRA